jgi:hypothetical protein
MTDHARAHAEAMDEALRESVVTVPVLRSELMKLEVKLRDQTIRIGGMIVAAVAVLAAIKYFG